MAKYWKYTPNAVTDKLSFDVRLADRQSTVRSSDIPPYQIEIVLAKQGGEWSVTEAIGHHNGSSIDSSEVESVTGDLLRIQGNDVIIKDITDYPVLKILCNCSANNGTPVEVTTVETKRIHFIKREWLPEYNMRSTQNPQYVGRFMGITRQMWYVLGVVNINGNTISDNQELKDIVFSNLTESVTLPGFYEQRSWAGFNGFGLLNVTCPDHTHSYNEHPLAFEFTDNGQYVLPEKRYSAGKLRAWKTYTRNGNLGSGNWNEINGEKLAALNDETTMANFAPDGIYYAFPLFYESGSWNYSLDEDNHGDSRSYDDICTEDLNPYHSSSQNN